MTAFIGKVVRSRIKDVEHTNRMRNPSTVIGKRTKPDLLKELSSDDFHTVIHNAVTCDDLPDDLKTEISCRLKNGELKKLDLFSLLILTLNKNEKWTDIRNEIMEWLKKAPHVAKGILRSGVSIKLWSEPDFEKRSNTDTENQMIYSSQASTVIGKNKTEKVESGWVSAYNSEKAEGLAALDLLSKLVNECVNYVGAHRE